MKQLIYFYILNGKRYIDFQVLLYLYEDPEQKRLHDRSTLYRYLEKNRRKDHKKPGIETIYIGNKHLYLLQDIFDDVTLLGKMQNITVILKAMEEN